MNVWWCNQGKCWTEERSLGVVCGCTHDVRRWTYRRTVGEVVKGDLTLHYVRQFIRAVSRAKSNGQEYPKLEGVKPNPYGRGFGWRFEAEYFPLSPAIPKESFIEALVKLRAESGISGFPITKTGRVQQGYFFPFSLAGLKVVKECFTTDWPAWVP